METAAWTALDFNWLERSLCVSLVFQNEELMS
jgi:hypothetical protein